MRVLQVGKYYPPYRGGMETVVQTLSEGLVQAAAETPVDVEVICSHIRPRQENETLNGVKVSRLATYGELLSQPLTPSFFAEIRRRQRQADVVHFHSPNPLTEGIAVLSGSGGGRCRRQVVTYHSDIVRQKAFERLYRPVLLQFLQQMDAIVVGSPQAIEHSPVLPEFKEKCHVIPFGLDPSPLEMTERRRQLVEELRQQYGRFALFTGRLVSYKGLDVLIEAMQSVSSPLVIMGTGPLLGRLKEQAAELGVQERVHILGRVDEFDRFAAFYHACDLFVLPSVTRAEAFGIVLLEAMFCGKPIVSTKLTSGVRFVNEEGVSGLQVAPGCAEELATAMQKIFDDEVLRTRLAQGARRRFEEMFTVEKMVSRYIQLYQSV